MVESATRGYLAGVHGNRREGGLRQRHCGAQQVPRRRPLLLVLAAVLHLQPLLRQDSFVTRSVARRGQELEFSMSPPKQKAHPERDACQGQLFLWGTQKIPNQQTQGMHY